MGMVGLDVQLRLTGTAISRINNAAKAAVRDLMDGVVLPNAREMSPKAVKHKVDEIVNADSLSTMTRQKGTMIQSYLRSNSGHGGYIEKGTSKMAARPYMQPAFERSLSQLDAILQARFEQFSELDEVIADGGVPALAQAIKTKRWRRKVESRKARVNRLLKEHRERENK